MAVRTHIEILTQLELSATEGKLFLINLKLITCPIYSVRKAGIEGINSLINQINYTRSFKHLFK